MADTNVLDRSKAALSDFREEQEGEFTRLVADDLHWLSWVVPELQDTLPK